MFITFEGGEGAGKTTQIKRLEKSLAAEGYQVITTREPGGTPEAEKIRTLLVERNGGNWDALSECLLFFTARRMHVETLIKPALADGKVVISDRFTDSTIAYQGYGYGFPLETITRVRDLSIGSFDPDLTFILDLPVDEGLKRAGKRLEESASTEDRFEQIETGFHENLRAGFLKIAEQDPERCRVINAGRDVETIASEIFRHTKERLA